MTVNIYLTKEEKSKLKELQERYKVSYSTIADKVIFYVIQAWPKDNTEITDKYLYDQDKNKNIKTSIKPRIFKGGLDNIPNKNRVATNCLKMYLKKDIKNYFNQVATQQIYSKVDTELRKTQEIFWNYNQKIRTEMRFLKENKEYLMKAIGELEN